VTNTPEDLYFKDADSTAQSGAGNYMAQPGMMSPVEAGASEGAPPPPTPVVGGTGSGGGGNRVALMVITALVAGLLIVGAGVTYFVFRASGGAPAAVSVTHSDGTVETGVPVETRSAEEVYDTYIAMSEDDSIFEIIPRTDEGWDYFRAFMYKITDYKAAELFGPLDQETLQEMAALERRFLALEDLELTIDITRTDGTTFVHDGKPPAPADASPAPSA
jgi:hypothetical protein